MNRECKDVIPQIFSLDEQPQKIIIFFWAINFCKYDEKGHVQVLWYFFNEDRLKEAFNFNARLDRK